MIIGIDVGGTKIEGVLWNKRKRSVVRFVRQPTPKTKEKFIKTLELMLGRLSRDAHITGVGIGIPGSFDYKGKILHTQNIPYLDGLNIMLAIKKLVPVPVAIDNDVSCIARAEFYFQSVRRPAKRIKNKTMFVIAPGTGIGGAIIFNRKVFSGATHSAGEVGHTILISNNKFSISKLKTLEQLYQIARDKKDYKKVGVLLGIAISNIIRILNPDIILIGGGLTDIHKKFMPEVRNVIKKFIPLPARKTPVKIVQRKRSAAIGAALLFSK